MPPEPASVRDDGFDMLDYLDAIRREKRVVLGITLITLAAALIVSFLKSPAYTSTATVLVKPTALNPAGSVPLASTINMPTEAQIARSSAVADMADAGGSPAETASHVSAIALPDSQILLISFSADDPPAAQSGATATADAYLSFRQRQALDDAAEAIAIADDQIRALQDEADSAAREAELLEPGSKERLAADNEVAQLNGRIAIWQNNASVINVADVNPGTILVPAGLPLTPSSPNHKKDAVVGLVLGLALGILAAITRDAMQRRRGDSPA